MVTDHNRIRCIYLEGVACNFTLETPFSEIINMIVTQRLEIFLCEYNRT